MAPIAIGIGIGLPFDTGSVSTGGGETFYLLLESSGRLQFESSGFLKLESAP